MDSVGAGYFRTVKRALQAGFSRRVVQALSCRKVLPGRSPTAGDPDRLADTPEQGRPLCIAIAPMGATLFEHWQVPPACRITPDSRCDFPFVERESRLQALHKRFCGNQFKEKQSMTRKSKA